HGTVVAGTVFSGSIRSGDDVAVFPSGMSVRVRSIHAQNRPVDVGHSGERCALSLPGVEKSTIRRGDWLSDPRAFSPSRRMDVRLEVLASDLGGPQPRAMVLKPWTPVHFHHGATHVTAHVVPLDRSNIAPGQSGRAQMIFETPVC